MDQLAQVRHILPWWVEWGPVMLWISVAFVVDAMGSIVIGLVSSVPLIGHREDHWTERARRSFPVRIALLASLLMVPMLTSGVASMSGKGICRLSTDHWIAAVWASGLGGALLAHALFSRRLIEPPITLGSQLRGMLCTWTCLFPHYLVVLTMGLIMPGRWGWPVLLILVAGGGLYALLLRGHGISVGRLVGLARPASPRLCSIVSRVGERLDVTPRAVFELAWDRANAFAYPLSGRLVYTNGLLRVLDDAEIESVTAHEMGHLKESSAVKATRLATACLLLPLALARPLVVFWGPWTLLAVLVMVLVAFLLFRRLASRMERRADRIATVSVSDPRTYARALEKIHRTNLVPATLRGRMKVHPHLYDRMISAGVQPDYPRPKPPSRIAGMAGLSVGVVITVLTCVSVMVGISGLRPLASRSRAGSMASLATGAGGAHELCTLGLLGAERGDEDRAIALLDASLALGSRNPECALVLGLQLARTDRCEESLDAIQLGRELSSGSGPVPEWDGALDEANRALAACEDRTGR